MVQHTAVALQPAIYLADCVKWDPLYECMGSQSCWRLLLHQSHQHLHLLSVGCRMLKSTQDASFNTQQMQQYMMLQDSIA